MKNLVRVEILGREYVVKSEEGEDRAKRIFVSLGGDSSEQGY